ncbi:MAG: hypothetical protein HXS47_10510 [Theionarchaea archaeon]|nr:hypothetical protein [Theionarchaea archaeon]
MKCKVIPIVCILILATIPMIGSQGGPDLKITSLFAVKDYNTNSTSVVATVKNVGTAGTGTGFYVELNVTSKGVGAGSNKQTLNKWCVRLGSNTSKRLTATFSGTAWVNAHAIADVTKLVNETNESNNSKGTCIFANIRDFNEVYETLLDVGNITYDAAEIQLVIDSISEGMTVYLDPSVVYLEPGEVTQVLMRVEFEPGFEYGQVVILGVYSDGYTVSPATIDFVDTNP